MTAPTQPGTGAGGAAPVRADDAETAWTAAAAAVLRRAGRLAADAPDSTAADRLTRTTVEGLPIPPLGTAALATTVPPSGLPGEPPYLRGSRVPDGTGWDIRSLVRDPDPATANSSVLADLENGVTSIWLTVGRPGTAPGELSSALAGVYLDLAPVALAPAGEVTDLAAAQAFRALIAGRGLRPHPAGTLGADPIGRAVRARRETVDLSDLAEICSVAQDLGVRALVVDGTAGHEAGAGDAGEIGYVLAVGAAYLRALTAAGLSVDAACGLLESRFAVTDEQFTSIAKLRAGRVTWHRMTELCGASAPARAQRQHAVTSPAMLTRHDPWVNLLRTTVSAFAAGVGGADALTVLPFDAALGVPDPFGRRLARNISALLLEESHLAKAADPAGGAFAVELLTAELADAGWAEFQRIEAAGGIVASMTDGSWRSRIEGTEAERRRRIATRRQPITGVSEFPLAAEVLPTRAGVPVTDGVRRWAEPFERLRDAPVAHPVVLCVVGNLGDAAARTLFVENLLAAGGIAFAHQTSETRQLIRGAAAILIGSDEAYAINGREAIAHARDEGAARVFLAGRPPESLGAHLDGHVAAGEDVLAFLSTLRAGEEVRS
jgi:methylmalonyl-CoA mutase